MNTVTIDDVDVSIGDWIFVESARKESDRVDVWMCGRVYDMLLGPRHSILCLDYVVSSVNCVNVWNPKKNSIAFDRVSMTANGVWRIQNMSKIYANVYDPEPCRMRNKNGSGGGTCECKGPADCVYYAGCERIKPPDYGAVNAIKKCVCGTVDLMRYGCRCGGA